MQDRYPPAPGAPDNHLVWVVSHGWHTGIVIDRAAARHGRPPRLGYFFEGRYLELRGSEDAGDPNGNGGLRD